MANDFSVLIKAILDKSGINTELKQIQEIVKKYSMEITPNLQTASLRNQLKSVCQEMANDFNKTFGTSITGNDMFKAFENQIKQADENIKQLAKSYQSIQKLEIKKNNLDTSKDVNEIAELNKQIQQATSDYNSLLASISKNANFDSSAWNETKTAIDAATKSQIEYNNAKQKDDLNSAISNEVSSLEKLKDKWDEQGVLVDEFKTKVEQLEASLGTVGSKGELDGLKSQIQTLKTEASQLAESNNIQLGIDTEKYSTEIFKLQQQLSNFGSQSGEAFTKATASLQQLEAAYKGMQTTNGDERLNYEKEYQTALSTTKNLLTQITSAKENELIVSGDSRRTKFIADLNNYLSKNTAMTEQSRQAILKWIATLDSADDITRGTFDNIRTEFTRLDATLRSSGQLGLSWTDKLKQAWEKFGGWGFATGTFMAVYSQLKKMPEAVYEIDTAMTELYKVTDETDARYTKFLTNACNNAKELGRTVSSLIEQTANWSKLGYSMDQAEELAKISSIYANVGEVDDDTAVSDLVTAMKAFNIEADNAIDIIDKLNALGNQYAVSSADLGEGLSNSASALALAGNSIDEALAMITAMSEITQSASESGNALKILSMRIRGYDEETESYSLDVAELTGQIADLTKTASTPGGISLFTDETKETYKSTYQLLSEISEIWDDLTDKNQAELLETLAGKMRGNSISALITNMAQANNALNDSINSAGSAYEEQERWLDSLEAKTAQFEAAFQSLSSTVVDSDVLKWFVDFGTGAVSALDAIIDKTGILLPMFSGVGIAAFVKNLDHQKVLKNCLDF